MYCQTIGPGLTRWLCTGFSSDATSVLRHARGGGERIGMDYGTVGEAHGQAVEVALTIKMARIFFALLTKGAEHRKAEWSKGMVPADTRNDKETNTLPVRCTAAR